MQKTFGLILFTFHGFVVCAQQTVLKGHVASFADVSISKSTSSTSSNNFKSIEKHEVSEQIEIQKFAPNDTDINFIPLFGNYTKTESQLIEDQMFLMDCDKSFKTRKEASDFFIKMAWQYLEEGSKNNAINRFNLAWLLDNKNIDTFWGLGVVEYQSGNLHEAVKLMARGLEASHDANPVLMVDLATIYLQIAVNNPISKVELNKAKELIEAAIKIQPSYSTAYSQMVVANLLENNDDAAWESFHKVYELNPREVNIELLQELLKRKPDPKGIFKP